MELYAEKGDPKYERAALKYLARYMDEENPSLADVAQVAALLAERSLLRRPSQGSSRGPVHIQVGGSADHARTAEVEMSVGSRIPQSESTMI